MAALALGMLLDTYAVIWLADGDPMPAQATITIILAATSPCLFVSPISAIAVNASQLPGGMHRDPADRLLIATARHLGVPIVTRDAQIIGKAEQRRVQVVPG